MAQSLKILLWVDAPANLDQNKRTSLTHLVSSLFTLTLGQA